MEMNNKLDLPWCPRCGGEMVRKDNYQANGEDVFTAWCGVCHFGIDEKPMYPVVEIKKAIAHAHRLVLVELCRYAHDIRAHSYALKKSRDMNSYNYGESTSGPLTFQHAMLNVRDEYRALRHNPIDLTYQR